MSNELDGIIRLNKTLAEQFALRKRGVELRSNESILGTISGLTQFNTAWIIKFGPTIERIAREEAEGQLIK